MSPQVQAVALALGPEWVLVWAPVVVWGLGLALVSALAQE